MTMSRPGLRRFGPGLIALAALIVGACQGRHVYGGVVEDPPRLMADVALVDGSGQPFQLSQLAGKWVLVDFGYTHCPDICPLTMSHLKQVKATLGSASDRVSVVFLTVDPERDTPLVMADYVQSYGPDFIGLTGDAAAVAKAAAAFGVEYAKVETGSAAGYAMSHTAKVFLLDGQRRLRVTYPFGVEPRLIADDLAVLLRDQD